jgi:hypothetical protein
MVYTHIMNQALFAVPFASRCLNPLPEVQRPLEQGCQVVWSPDGDQGYVTSLITGQAVAVRWEASDCVEWYPLSSFAVHQLKVLGKDVR